MAYKDGEVFTTYCDKEYDRHTYRLHWKDGSHTDYEVYEYVRYFWYQHKDMAESVEILDVSRGKGF